MNTLTNFFWEITGYVGLPALLLAAVAGGLALWSRNRLLVPAVVILVPSLLLALGKEGGLAWVFYHALPGFSFFRFHSRFLLYVDLALAIMAGFALRMILARIRVSPRLTVIIAIVAVGLCFGDLYRVFGDHNPRIKTETWARRHAYRARNLDPTCRKRKKIRLMKN